MPAQHGCDVSVTILPTMVARSADNKPSGTQLPQHSTHARQGCTQDCWRSGCSERPCAAQLCMAHVPLAGGHRSGWAPVLCVFVSRLVDFLTAQSGLKHNQEYCKPRSAVCSTDRLLHSPQQTAGGAAQGLVAAALGVARLVQKNARCCFLRVGECKKRQLDKIESEAPVQGRCV